MLGAATVALVFVTVSAGTVDAVTPVDGGDVAGTTITVDNDPGDQVDPQVSGDLATYTDYTDPTQGGAIHYFDFTTSVDHAVPRDPGAPTRSRM